jgi:DivIVA domain-containing protein
MVLTPTDVANKQFRNSFRGYNEDEVDAFLDTVEAELVRLLTENAGLQARVDELERGSRPGVEKKTADATDAGRSQPVAPTSILPTAAAAAGPAPAAGPAAAADPAPSAGAEPQRSGPAAFFGGDQRDERAQARPTSPPASAAEPDAAGAPSASESRGDVAALRTLQLAQRTADAAVAEAQAEAQALLRSAQERASKLDQDAQSLQQQVLGTLDTRRRQLEKHIEDLRAYEREYRSRLRTYLEAQLRQLNGQSAAAPGSAPPPPPDPTAGDRLSGSGADGAAPPSPSEPHGNPGNGSAPEPATPSAAGPQRQATPFHPGPKPAEPGAAGAPPPPAPPEQAAPPPAPSGS